MDGWVVLPDHSGTPKAGERGIGQRRYWEHAIRNESFGGIRFAIPPYEFYWFRPIE